VLKDLNIHQCIQIQIDNNEVNVVIIVHSPLVKLKLMAWMMYWVSQTAWMKNWVFQRVWATL